MKNKIIKTLIFITFIFILISINNSKTYAAMSNATITLSNYSYTYTGKSIKPGVTVKYRGKTLKKGTDYSVMYSNNKNAGTGKVKITGLRKGLGGQVTKRFTINKKSISGYRVSNYTTSYTYDGNAKKPSISIVGLSKKNYKVTYSNNKKPGKATITITGTGNYTGAIKKSFTINKLKIKDCNIKIYDSHLVYNGGKSIKPSYEISYGKKSLKLNTDYTIKYSDNKNAGTGKIKFTGKGVYSGSTTKTFKIQPQSIDNSYHVICNPSKYKNTGKLIKFSVDYVYLYYSDKKMKKNTDFTVSYSFTKDTKNYIYGIIIKGKGNYKGEKKFTYKIPKSCEKFVIGDGWYNY